MSPPNPEELATVGDGKSAVLAHDSSIEHGLFYRNGGPHEDAITIDAFASDAIEAFGDDGALDSDFCTTTARHPEGDAPVAERIFWKFVAVALNVEVDSLTIRPGS